VIVVSKRIGAPVIKTFMPFGYTRSILIDAMFLRWSLSFFAILASSIRKILSPYTHSSALYAILRSTHHGVISLTITWFWLILKYGENTTIYIVRKISIDPITLMRYP
jgi:hypothetical protein